MGRIGLAFRLFFKVLGDASFAEAARPMLEGGSPPAPAPAQRPAQAPTPKVEARNDAITLLSVLQREARLVDFLKEPIAGYSDAQIGAAARDVHRDAAAVLDRLFAPRPVLAQAEGSSVEIPAGAGPGRVRLVGALTGQPPYRGTLRHPGWEASKIDLPAWTGAPESLNILAPAEVEL